MSVSASGGDSKKIAWTTTIAATTQRAGSLRACASTTR
jgi:hypothetical protein